METKQQVQAEEPVRIPVPVRVQLEAAINVLRRGLLLNDFWEEEKRLVAKREAKKEAKEHVPMQ